MQQEHPVLRFVIHLRKKLLAGLACYYGVFNHSAIDDCFAGNAFISHDHSFLPGMAYGIGGTVFGIAIRYVGFSLTFAIAVGIIQFCCWFSDEGMEKLQHGNHLPVAVGTFSFNNCLIIANLL